MLRIGRLTKGHYLYDGFSRLTVRTIGANEAGNKVLSVPMLGGGGLIDSLMPGATEAYSGLGNRIIAEADASGVTKREYIWAGNIVVGVIDAANSASPSLYFVQNDHLGRPIRMRNAAKQDVWYANYRPFGEAIIAGPASLDMRLPGQWFQMETGLSWNWHRTYDPSLGRYLQPDPLGLTDGPSIYGYAHQSPMMGIDPEGLGTAGVAIGGQIGGIVGGRFGGSAGAAAGRAIGAAAGSAIEDMWGRSGSL